MLARYVQQGVTWIDLVSPSAEEVRSLVHEFDMDPLIAEELLVPSYKSKVERRGNEVYVILHFPVLRGVTRRPEQEIDFVIGKHYLITTRYGSVDPLHAFAKAFEVNAVLGRHGSMQNGGHLFVSMTRNLYNALEAECDALTRHLQTIEEGIFEGKERDMVVELSQTGRVLHDFRQSLMPHEDMLASLEPSMTRLFGPEFSYHLRSVMGEYNRVKSVLENLRDSVIELRETNNSLLSTKQNETMKTLTVIAFLFLPLTFIGQLFGMSLPIPLAHTPNGFWIVISFMTLVAVGCFGYVKYRGWL